MCGGIIINANRIPKKELRDFIGKEKSDQIQKNGKIASFFWDKRPFLPVEQKGEIHLYDWGNRDKNLDFPKTGWAKIESIKEGKWNWLKPEEVKIPALKGYEKHVWFDFEDGINGIIANLNNQKRVYMVTEQADDIYFAKTSHNRMPIGKKSNFQKIVQNTKIAKKTSPQ